MKHNRTVITLVSLFLSTAFLFTPTWAIATESEEAETAPVSQEEMEAIESAIGSVSSASRPKARALRRAPAVTGTASSKIVVALDPGHGGTDSGALGYGLEEKDINLRIALACAQELESKGVDVVLTRDSDAYCYSANATLELQARCTKAYKAGASIYVSLHCNSASGSADGAEVWYPQDVPFNNDCYTTGQGLASTILTGLTENSIFGIRSRGIFTKDYGGGRYYSDGSSCDWYAVIRHCREYDIPAVIVEHGFIDNLSDSQSLKSNAEAMGKADADAILDYLSLGPRWEEDDNGQWKLLEGNSYVTSAWRKLNNAWYWLDADGYRATGWQFISGRWYHFSESGTMDYGWLLDGTTWYWLGGADDGSMATGWANINGVWYYLQPSSPGSGAMLTGWADIDGKRYYFNGSGSLASGWLYLDNSWYYLHSEHDGHFGEMDTGWLRLGGTWYWLDLTTGRAAEDEKLVVAGTPYAFSTSCAMGAGGWCLSDGKWYWCGTSGALECGWELIRGTWYWMDPTTYAMVQGWQDIHGSTYYFTTSGAMATGWASIGGKWYYFGESGAMWANRWQGNYYLGSDGAMAVDQWIGPYYVGADGAWIVGYGG